MKNKSKFLILIFICILIYKIFKKNREVEDHDETISDNDETISDNDETISDNDETISDNDETISDNDETISDNGKWYFLLFIIICILLVFFYRKTKTFDIQRKEKIKNIVKSIDFEQEYDEQKKNSNRSISELAGNVVKIGYNKIKSIEKAQYMFYDDYIRFIEKLPSIKFLRDEIDPYDRSHEIGLNDQITIIEDTIKTINKNLDSYDYHINNFEDLPTYEEVFLSVNDRIPTGRDMYRDYPADFTAYEVAFTRKYIEEYIDNIDNIDNRNVNDIIDYRNGNDIIDYLIKITDKIIEINEINAINKINRINKVKYEDSINNNVIKYANSISRIIEESKEEEVLKKNLESSNHWKDKVKENGNIKIKIESELITHEPYRKLETFLNEKYPNLLVEEIHPDYNIVRIRPFTQKLDENVSSVEKLTENLIHILFNYSGLTNIKVEWYDDSKSKLQDLIDSILIKKLIATERYSKKREFITSEQLKRIKIISQKSSKELTLNDFYSKLQQQQGQVTSMNFRLQSQSKSQPLRKPKESQQSQSQSQQSQSQSQQSQSQSQQSQSQLNNKIYLF
jgi:hypothetical protein